MHHHDVIDYSVGIIDIINEFEYLNLLYHICKQTLRIFNVGIQRGTIFQNIYRKSQGRTNNTMHSHLYSRY